MAVNGGDICFAPDILPNVFLWVQQNKCINTGLKHPEGEKIKAIPLNGISSTITYLKIYSITKSKYPNIIHYCINFWIISS